MVKKHHTIPTAGFAAADSAAAVLPRWRVCLKVPTYYACPRTPAVAQLRGASPAGRARCALGLPLTVDPGQ